MEKYISLLIFIVPGFFARHFIDEFLEKDEVKGELEKILISLIYGLPIWIISMILIYFLMDIKTISDIKSSINDMGFILKYILITIFSTLLFSLLVLIYELKCRINLIKKFIEILKLDRKIADEDNCWKEFFKTNKDGKIIGVFKGENEIVTGVLKHNSTNNSLRSEVILTKVSLTEELKKKFCEVDNVYIDFQNDILIKEYKFKEDENKEDENKEDEN